MNRKVKRYSGEDESFVEDSADDPIAEIIRKAEIDKANSRHYFNPLDPKETARSRGIDHGEEYSGDKTASYKAEAGVPWKERIVSKKELADSGLTLREFLNRERKLKPRGAATPKKAAETKVPEATPAQLAERKKQERAQALEESHPEALIIGGPLLKAGRAGLAALRSAKEVGKRIEPYIASTGRDLATRGGREVGKRMDDLRTIYDDGIPKLANKAVQLGTEALKLSRFKHGGSVKASKMGSVKTAKPKMTSASSRGDGIAQRGKTKGRIC